MSEYEYVLSCIRERVQERGVRGGWRGRGGGREGEEKKFENIT